MKNLVSLQAEFQEHLLDTNNLAIEDAIVSTAHVSAHRRLGIYAYGYKARLFGVLAENYPILKDFLGEEEFETIGYSYIDAYPSSLRSIRWFGDKFALFLQNHPDYINRPELSELAKVEWILGMVFDAQDAPVLQVEALGTIPPDAWSSLCFKSHPSLQRINLSWNVVQIWKALKEGEPIPTVQKCDAPTLWVFWRSDLINKFCSVQESEAFALDAMIRGATFEEICESLCTWIDEDAVGVHAAGLLKGWILAGFIEDVKY